MERLAKSTDKDEAGIGPCRPWSLLWTWYTGGRETLVSPRKPYPTDVSDDEWAFVLPSLTLMTPAAPQRTHDLRAVCNAVRWIVHTGAPWR